MRLDYSMNLSEPLQYIGMVCKLSLGSNIHKIGDMCEQLFRACISLYFDENVEPIDSYFYMPKTCSNTVRLW